ncbi:TniB family NTP-binding protein [Microcella sp.]|uniref:TniB family NTP-binding protein n=1 Tax=Microcella sp. TaxID=1913979 RepID=UPI003F6EB974
MFFHSIDRPATLNQREGLMQYLQNPPRRPELLNREQLAALSEPARAEYNRQRIVHLSGGILINTPYLMTAKKMLVRSFAANVGRNSGHTGLMISGNSTVGKTTTTKALMQYTFLQYCKQFPDFEAHNRIPIVYIEVPAASTAKLLMRTFADFFGLSVRNSESMDSIRKRVIDTLHDAGTQLIVVDELHNLAHRNVGNGDSVDVLKSLHNDVAATFVYAGIDLLSGNLLAGTRGQQIASRFEALQMLPYLPHDTERGDWVKLLASYERELLLTEHPSGSIPEMRGYLYERTSGSVGSLSRLLSSAAIEAITNRELPEVITQALLETIRVDHTAEARRRATEKLLEPDIDFS